MAFSPKQRAAIFEKLKSIGRINTGIPKPPALAQPKAINPIMPRPIPVIPGAPAANPNKVNMNYIGAPKAQRFKKVKNMLGQ